MAKVKFDEESCKGCGLCVTVCPKKIIEISQEINSNGYFVAKCIDNDKCIGCAFCATICPDCVIEVYK